MFVGNSASGGQTFEVMVWLGLYGDISPLSSNGYPFKPIASVDVGNGHFHLAYGLNGNVKVYSFVAKTHANKNFNGDLVSAINKSMGTRGTDEHAARLLQVP